MKKSKFLSSLFEKMPSKQVLTFFLVLLVIFNLVLLGVIAQDREEKRFLKEIERYVDSSCEEFGIPKAMVFAIIKTESNFDQHARSSADARGLMQITSVALKDINRILSEDYTFTQMYDPEINIRCGVAYLSVLYRKYEIFDTAFAAYNAGQGNVDNWLSDSRYSYDRKQLYHIPFKETKNYVKKVNHYYQEYQKQYGEN
ncbi:MAG: lytic transglycosylase domain-containing protein [Clostridia bacterium]|nr:lytic transglycosylase domain-containing protein [Clostridia bacterium]